MKVVRPTLITSANLTTNVAETVSPYNAGTTYSYGQFSRDASGGNHVFLSAANDNTGKALTNQAWWIDTGASNPLKMFDLYNGSQTINTTAISTTVAVDGRADSVCLFNLSADSVTIKAVASGGPSRTNHILRSQEFDNAAWTKNTTSVSANAVIAPDGTLTADVLTAGGADSYVIQSFGASDGPYCGSVWLKVPSGSATVFLLVLDNNGHVDDFLCNLTTEWQRFEVSVTKSGGTQVSLQIGAGGSFSTGEIMHVWGAQVETGSAATDYIATTTAAVTTTDFNAKFETYSLRETSMVTDWWSYFFEEITYRANLTVTDIPNYENMNVSVNIAGTVGSTVACGTCVIGPSKTFGNTTVGVRFSIDDQSIKTKDDFGRLIIVERPYSDALTIPVFLQNIEINAIKQTFAEFRATPAVYIASERFDPTIAFGFGKLAVDVAYYDYSSCSVEVEGVP